MRALEGVKVLDLSRTLAGPFCTMMLGDMGADIIKVEQPGKGDETRKFTPPTWDGESCYFLSSNRNKRSIAIDIKSTEGKEVIYKLVQETDVLVENFRTGALDKLGFGYDRLKELNPGLIYCSISGFGRTGPERERPGYDLLIQGYSGLMSITGEKDGPPVKSGTSIVDLTTGMFAAFGIVSAIIARQQTGKGQFIDASLLDSQVAMLNFLGTNYMATGKSPERLGSAHPSLVPYQAFAVRDGNVILAVANNGLWEKCCRGFGWKDLLSEERYTENAGRVLHREELIEDIQFRLALLDKEEVFRLMDAAGVPCGPIHSVEEVMNNEQVLARGMVLEIDHPIVNGLKIPGFPLKLSDTPPVLERHPPLLGEHTKEILCEIGYGEELIDELLRSNIVEEAGTKNSTV